MQLNSRGDAALGAGSNGAAVILANDEILTLSANAGGTAWFSDSVAIYQACDGNNCRVYGYSLLTRQPIQVAPRGANVIRAGGNLWAAWLDGYGLFTSDGDHFERAGLLDVGPDGSLAYKPSYHSLGPVMLRQRSGSEWLLLTAAPRDLQLLGGDRAIYAFAGEGVGVVGALPAPITLDPAEGLWRPRAAKVGGEWWIAYFHGSEGGRLVLHPFDSLEGYVIGHGHSMYSHDLVGINHVAVIAYAAREGEQATDLRRRFIDTGTEPRVNLRTVGDPKPEDPEPEQPKPEEPEPMNQMTLPDDVHRTFVAVVAKFPHTGDEHDRRVAMRKAIETLRARHGERWVWKTQHNTGYEAASKDAINYVPASEGPIRHGQRMRMYTWDAINGTTREPLPAGALSEELAERYVLAPAPIDWLEGDVEKPRDPEEPREPEPGKCNCAAELKALEAKLLEMIQVLDEHAGQVTKRVTALEARPATTPKTLRFRVKGNTTPSGSSFLRHAHGIDVEGVAEVIE